MGFFSWKTCDTNRSISNVYSIRDTFPISLLTPHNTYILEENYEGYGIFGGLDAYALLARWNVPELCNGVEDHDRIIGINLDCHSPEKIKFPLRFFEHPRDTATAHLNYTASKHCSEQGFFYDDYPDDEPDEYLEDAPDYD